MDRFESQAAWFGLIVPAVPLISGLSALLRSCPSGGLDCLGRFLTGAFLIVVAAPTAVVLGPVVAWIDTGTVATTVAVVLSVLTSGPLWWFAARRVARGVGTDEGRPWGAFLFRWLGVCGVWFGLAVAVTLITARLLV